MNTEIKFSTADLEKKLGGLTFARLLAAYRLAEDKSQKDFAKFLKISQQSLCDLEKGRKIPSPERAAKIASRLKEPKNFWIQLAIQDFLREQNLYYAVNLTELKNHRSAA